MTDRLLLKGGHVLTVDPDLGDLVGDVLIEDGRIAAVGADLGALSGPRALIEASKEHLLDTLPERQAESG